MAAKGSLAIWRSACRGVEVSKILLLAGDGIGPEVVAEAEKVLAAVDTRFALGLEFEHGLIGGAAIDATGRPLPDQTLEKARESDAILLGAVGGPMWDGINRALRPKRLA